MTFGQAKDRARDLQRDAAQGRDRFAETRVPSGGDSLDSLIRTWIERHGKQHKRSWTADLRRHELHIAPRLGGRSAGKVTRGDVIALLDDIAAKVGPIQANRVQAVLSAAFSWALDEGLVESHPAHRIRKRGKEKARDRHLSDDEINRFWLALDGLPSSIADALRLLLLLGQRRGEVSGLRTDELNLDTGPVWTLPSSRTKNKLAHVVPLPPFAANIITRQVPNGPFVFPARLVEPKAMEGLTLSARFADTVRNLGVEDVRLHDLRHTFKTGLARLGVSESISDRVTNQITGQRARVGARYDHHTYLDEKRDALAQWEATVMTIVGH